MHNQAAFDAGQPHYLREMMALVAGRLPLEQAVERLLTLAQAATGALGGRVLLIVKPRLSINVGEGENWNVADERLTQALGDLLPGMPPEPVSFGRNGRRSLTALLTPITDDRVIGGIVLLFRGSAPSGALEVLADVASALRIVVMQARRDTYDQHTPLFERTVAALSDPMVILDRRKHVLYLNPAGVNAFGISLLQAEGLPVSALPGLEPLATALADEVMPERWTREGSDKVYVPRLTAMDEGFVLSFSDVTRYEKLELNPAEFIRNAAHDVRSPLGPTLMFIGLLEETLQDADNAPALAMLKKIEHALSVVDSNIDNILDAGKYNPETGFYLVQRRHVDMQALAERIISNLLITPDKKLTLNVEVDKSLPTMNIDPFLIERAAMNLLDNAIKYTPSDGRIDLIITRDAENLLVGVRDNGYGISPADQRRLFLQYVRLKRREHSKVKGTGLGLFIVRSIARLHGGDAWVESVEGQGSTFWLNIPLVEENLAIATV